MAKARASTLSTSSWKDQFKGAIILSAGKCIAQHPLLPINTQATAGESQFDSLEADYVPTCVDYICHFLSLFWKILFAFVPPTGNSAADRVAATTLATKYFNNLQICVVAT